MEENKMVEERIYDSDGGENFPTELSDLIDFLEDMKSKVPYGLKAKLNVRTCGGWDGTDTWNEFYISYERPENDEEYLERKERWERMSSLQEERDREKYEALKAKFG